MSLQHATPLPCPNCSSGVEMELDPTFLPIDSTPSRLTDDEISRVHAILTNSQTRLDTLSRRLVHLDILRNSCITERQRVAQYIADHKALLAPIRRIPVEVLTRIFHMTLPSAEEWEEIYFQEYTQSPWILTRVCRHWHRIAYSTPTLWSYIFIQLHRTRRRASCTEDTILDALEKQIELSGSVLLHVSIKIDPIRMNRWNEFLSLLIANSERWSSLYLDVLNPELVQDYLDSIQGRLSSLRRLELMTPLDSPTLFADAPCLAEVSLCRPLDHLQLPWGQLTVYEGQSEYDAGRIVDLCPHLEYARLFCPTFPAAGRPPARLAQLKTLYVCDGGVLDVLTAPAVTDLSIMVYDLHHRHHLSDEHRPLASLPTFIRNSGCTLLRLTVMLDVPLDVGGLIEALTLCPALLELRLQFDRGDGVAVTRAFQSLTFNQTNNVANSLLPHLEVLRLASYTEHSMDYESFLAMLESRTLEMSGYDSHSDNVQYSPSITHRPRTRLHKTELALGRLRPFRSMDRLDRSRLDTLRGCGLCVSLTSNVSDVIDRWVDSDFLAT